jgi:hypothetical protein
MEKLTIVIRRNTSPGKGMYGLSIHDQPGGAGNAEPITSEVHLRKKLLGFGFSEARVKEVIGLLEDNDSVKLDAPHRERSIGTEKSSDGFTYTCPHCSWTIFRSMEQANYEEVRREFYEHACPDFPKS